MFRFYITKLINNLISLFIFLTTIFFLIQVMIPYDFTVQFSLAMNLAERERLAEELGLNLPLHQQYVHWLSRVVRGEFGTSFYGYNIADTIKHVLPVTLLIFLIGTVIAFLIGQWLGRVTAWKGPGLLTGTATFSAVALYTTFPAWLGFLLVYFLTKKFGLIPMRLSQNPFAGLMQKLPDDYQYGPIQIITRMLIGLGIVFVLVLIANYLVKRFSRRHVPALVQLLLVIVGWVGIWFVLGLGMYPWEILKLAAIPILTYVLISLGETMLIMQTSMRDTLNEEYIRTARGKGLPETKVRDRHATPNAIIPVFSRMVVSLPYLLTGIVIIEAAVDWPGMGYQLYNSLYQQDMPVVMAIMLIVGLISMAARLVFEFLELYLDPRLRDEVATVTVDMNGK